MKDPAVKMTEKVIDALSYAHKHNLDIDSKEDVQKILEAINPEHSSIEDTEEFMKLLQAANVLIEKDVERRRTTN